MTRGNGLEALRLCASQDGLDRNGSHLAASGSVGFSSPAHGLPVLEYDKSQVAKESADMVRL